MGRPIDQGGVEALIPGSESYSHLCQTNVTSYAIAGSWKLNVIFNHGLQEWFYKYITGNIAFRLDDDGFKDENDMLVSVTSQLGDEVSRSTLLRL
jgi:hypothetical protein